MSQTFAGVGVAAEAIRQLTDNRGIKRQPIPSAILKAAEDQQRYIFSVAPWHYWRPLGTLGSYFIPSCKAGERYSDACIVPGVVIEDVYIGVMGDGQFELRTHDGLQIAMDVLGTGMHQDPTNSLVLQGVFLADGPVPTEDELRRAETNLRQHYTRLLVEADAEYADNRGIRNIQTAQGPKVVSAIKTQHVEAAMALGVQRPWLGEDFEETARKALEAKSCEHCNATYTGTPAFCPQGCVLDLERARKARPHLFAEEKRGPGRPPVER